MKHQKNHTYIFVAVKTEIQLIRAHLNGTLRTPFIFLLIANEKNNLKILTTSITTEKGFNATLNVRHLIEQSLKT